MSHDITTPCHTIPCHKSRHLILQCDIQFMREEISRLHSQITDLIMREEGSFVALDLAIEYVDDVDILVKTQNELRGVQK